VWVCVLLVCVCVSVHTYPELVKKHMGSVVRLACGCVYF